jgi:xanthine dehydrogenase YagR molybdenum-binding subunit
MTDTSFPRIKRIDARDKVMGAAIYGADDARPEIVHGAMAISTINKGRLASIDTSAARAVDGVLLVLTHKELAGLKQPGFLFGEGFAFQSFQPITSDQIFYRGQPIAFVVAETLEAATYAASLVKATYETQPFVVSIASPAPDDIIVQSKSPLPQPAFGDRVTGDADKAYVDAPVKVDSVYTTPPQHQSPIELVACVAEWRDGTLMVHEGTQNANGIRFGLARELDLSAEKIEVISPYAGGGFGQKNSMQMQTALAAFAARELKRPVKVVVPRQQIFHDTSFRPASHHRIRMGADRNGRLVAAIHESDSQTSRIDLFPTLYTDLTARLHGIANYRGQERLVRTDTQTPGFMRTPWEHVSTFAFESAVDEIAYELNMDPVELRLNNEPKVDPLTNLPFSSRHVAECLERGAKRFGWSKRTMEPGSKRDKDGTLIGWGVSIGAYPGTMVPQIVHLAVTDQGTATIGVGGHEMGQGIRNVVAAVLSRKLGIPDERITVEVGDTRAVPQHLTAGAWGTASVSPAIDAAADAMLKALKELSPNARAGQPPAEVLKSAGRSSLEVEIRHKAPGQPDQIFGRLEAGLLGFAGPVFPDYVTFSYVAHFVEVRIEPGIRRVRVPRVVSVVDCGRVVSPQTAESQVRGGVVWGIGAALREASEVDPRYGGFLNADLAEYALPVNLDIGTIEVELVDKPDPSNSTGVKGLGEVVMSGVAPAITNAIFHATGRRLRNLPIRIEDVM